LGVLERKVWTLAIASMASTIRAPENSNRLSADSVDGR
jgi:hypothetical protein